MAVKNIRKLPSRREQKARRSVNRWRSTQLPLSARCRAEFVYRDREWGKKSSLVAAYGLVVGSKWLDAFLSPGPSPPYLFL